MPAKLAAPSSPLLRSIAPPPAGFKSTSALGTAAPDASTTTAATVRAVWVMPIVTGSVRATSAIATISAPRQAAFRRTSGFRIDINLPSRFDTSAIAAAGSLRC